MRRIPKIVRVLAVVGALSLVATACSDEEPSATPDGGTTDGTTGETEGEAPQGGTVSSYLGEPRSLITTDASESEGIAVLDPVYATLVEYDPETSAGELVVAESIESEDNQNYTITLKDGFTFHNGEPVTAESFVNAWNYGASGENAQQNAGFFADIEGYSELQCGTTLRANPETGEEEEQPDCENQPPTATELSGLQVVSDNEFTVALSEPQSFFPQKLGYIAFAPLPQAFFEDPEGFNEQPIGNGPFMLSEPWQHDQQITLERYPDYAGPDVPNIDGIEFRIYADVNTAVTDLLAGNLDIVDSIPPERFAEVQQQLGEGQTAETPTSSINYLGFPLYDSTYGDDLALRQALSLAIDQQQIVDTIFEGLRQPAYNLYAPVIPGYEDQVCDSWGFDPERAKQLFEQAGGVDALETRELWFNEGAGHDQWIQAVTTQWETVLGIPADSWTFRNLQFAEYLEVADNKGFTGPFRLGWGMDYPHPQNYAELLLDIPANEGGANVTFYDSEEFDAKLQEALSITNLDEAIPVWQEVMEIACNDVPLIPMFYGLNTFGWNSPVNNVFVDAFSQVDWSRVTVEG